MLTQAPKENDTIVALTTPAGYAGVAVVRLSGPGVEKIINQICDQSALKPRHATLCQFLGADRSVIDQGIALYFPAPNSFTGESVLELQGHGGPVVVDMLIQSALSAGARMAEPGEFSQRAFLNGKMDLTQIEAVADLIHANSEAAVKGALKSLSGEFSNAIDALNKQLIYLRVYVESALDFAEEEIDFLSDDTFLKSLESLDQSLDKILSQAKAGVVLKEGKKIALIGRPNAGKSSLLNALAQKDLAIVTDIPGTTRDALITTVHYSGVCFDIVDTAGIRDNPDPVEAEGIRRAREHADSADYVLLLIDLTEYPTAEAIEKEVAEWAPQINTNYWVVLNKKDQLTALPALTEGQHLLSARQGEGVDALLDHLVCALRPTSEEGVFAARRRHVRALEQAKDIFTSAKQAFLAHQAGELLAEDLRAAQICLGEITGTFSNDDLLGEIFSSFCIGK